MKNTTHTSKPPQDNEEKAWDEYFAKSQDRLASLGSEAIREYKEGKARKLP